MATYEQVYAEIVEYLRVELGVSKKIDISPNSSVSRSMKIDSDDLSFLLVPDLEKKFGKKLGNKLWSEIETVEDIARAFAD
jgi:acyl carrier protein